jgi:hypothetical protein
VRVVLRARIAVKGKAEPRRDRTALKREEVREEVEEHVARAEVDQESVDTEFESLTRVMRGAMDLLPEVPKRGRVQYRSAETRRLWEEREQAMLKLCRGSDEWHAVRIDFRRRIFKQARMDRHSHWRPTLSSPEGLRSHYPWRTCSSFMNESFFERFSFLYF